MGAEYLVAGAGSQGVMLGPVSQSVILGNHPPPHQQGVILITSSDHDQIDVRSHNVPEVLHSLLAAAPGEPELAPAAPPAVVLPQHQLGRGGVAPAGKEVQGEK